MKESILTKAIHGALVSKVSDAQGNETNILTISMPEVLVPAKTTEELRSALEVTDTKGQDQRALLCAHEFVGAWHKSQSVREASERARNTMLALIVDLARPLCKLWATNEGGAKMRKKTFTAMARTMGLEIIRLENVPETAGEYTDRLKTVEIGRQFLEAIKQVSKGLELGLDLYEPRLRGRKVEEVGYMYETPYDVLRESKRQDGDRKKKKETKLAELNKAYEEARLANDARKMTKIAGEIHELGGSPPSAGTAGSGERAQAERPMQIESKLPEAVQNAVTRFLSNLVGMEFEQHPTKASMAAINPIGLVAQLVNVMTAQLMNIGAVEDLPKAERAAALLHEAQKVAAANRIFQEASRVSEEAKQDVEYEVAKVNAEIIAELPQPAKDEQKEIDAPETEEDLDTQLSKGIITQAEYDDAIKARAEVDAEALSAKDEAEQLGIVEPDEPKANVNG